MLSSSDTQEMARTNALTGATLIVMGPPAESLKLDDDVHEELRKLSERSGRPLGVLANDALRDFLRHEGWVAAAIDRGVCNPDRWVTVLDGDSRRQ